MSDKPKLSIVREDDEHTEVWIDGRFIIGAGYDELGSKGMAAVESAARHVARALGAEVETTDDPGRPPYRYFVSYQYSGVHRDPAVDGLPPIVRQALGRYNAPMSGFGCTFYTTSDKIGTDDDLLRLVETIKAAMLRDQGITVESIAPLTITFWDGPS